MHYTPVGPEAMQYENIHCICKRIICHFNLLPILDSVTMALLMDMTSHFRKEEFLRRKQIGFSMDEMKSLCRVSFSLSCGTVCQRHGVDECGHIHPVGCHVDKQLNLSVR